MMSVMIFEMTEKNSWVLLRKMLSDKDKLGTFTNWMVKTGQKLTL